MATVVDKLEEIKKVLEDMKAQQQRLNNNRSGGGGSNRGSGGGDGGSGKQKPKKTPKSPANKPINTGKPKGGGIGASLKGAGAGLGRVAGGVGRAAGIAGAAVAVVVGVTIAIKKFGESLVAANRHLGQYSVTLEKANLNAQVRELQRQALSAQATGPQLAELSDALQDLYDELRPIKDLITNVGAKIATMVVRWITGLVEAINDSEILKTIVKYLEGILGEIKKDEGQGLDNVFFQNAALGNFDRIKAPKTPQPAAF